MHACDGNETFVESSTNGYMQLGASSSGNSFMLAANIWNSGNTTHYPVPVVSHFNGVTYAQSSNLSVGDSTTYMGNYGKTISFYTVYNEPSEFKAYLAAQHQAGTPVTFILPLANPTTYTLTASQIMTLLGTNHVWSDAGNVTLDYIGDKYLPADQAVSDVQVNGTSVVTNGVANVPVATDSTGGIVKIGEGLVVDSNEKLNVLRASDAQVKIGAAQYRPIMPISQHLSAFYGLAKAAGDTTQAASSNAVGTYTDNAKSAIKTMIGVKVEDVQVAGTSVVDSQGVANIQFADGSGRYGVVKLNNAMSLGLVYDTGISGGYMRINGATEDHCKQGTAYYMPVCPVRQHASTFYGLAKAAGDTTQA